MTYEYIKMQYVGESLSKYRVVCGEHNINREDSYEVEMRVTDIIMHPDYFSASKSGRDMAIYKVDDAPLIGNVKRKRIWPVCLPETRNDYDGDEAIVAGWGVTTTKFIRVIFGFVITIHRRHVRKVTLCPYMFRGLQ